LKEPVLVLVLPLLVLTTRLHQTDRRLSSTRFCAAVWTSEGRLQPLLNLN